MFRPPESAMSATGVGPFQKDLLEVGGDIKKDSREQSHPGISLLERHLLLCITKESRWGNRNNYS